MSTQVRLQDIQNAWNAGDPELPGLIAALAAQPDEKPETPVREGAPTFEKFLAEIQSKPFYKKSKEEQALYRIKQIEALEAEDAEVPLPERLKLHEIIMTLWQGNSPFARSCLLEVIAKVRLTYGPWRALKRIFKEAEERGDTEIMGALAARFDAALADEQHDVSRKTLGYLCRRAWRYLRRTAVSLPVCYADAASDVLACYTDSTRWQSTGVANHIFFHETGKYSRKKFNHYGRKDSLLKNRAYPDLWRRTPRPLFALLERAGSEWVRCFAVDALQTDFRAALREIEPSWVARLVNANSAIIDEFVVWILKNAPRFEQAAFRELGLHEAVLNLFDSPSNKAREYAADYARTHARDLPVNELVRLMNNNSTAVRKLAKDLLLSLDPRKDVGLDAWGRLLETVNGYESAAAVLRKHFGARELTPEWFRDRLLSQNLKTFNFAKEHLARIHPFKKLGPDFFRDLVDELDESDQAARRVAAFALDEIAHFDVNELDKDFLKRMFLHPLCSHKILAWFDEGRLKPGTLDTAFYKTLAYHPAWETDRWLELLKQGGKTWTKDLVFDEGLSYRILEWFKDVRRFSAKDLGFDWLMELVDRSEPEYHDFAVGIMIKSFAPADFADKEAEPEVTAPEDATVDFNGISFLFTGKMATMPRKDAQNKVRQGGGKIASGVTGKLDYLVIGDEGSPLYDSGRKGSKQVKAEKLKEGGADVRIISETAFLQMLSGKKSEASDEAVTMGCTLLWDMATCKGKEDTPRRRFALEYIRLRHPDICLAETDRPVDPGTEVPDEFLSFERFKPLFADNRQALRDFALEFGKWEFARWSPLVTELIELCELPDPKIRTFVSKALLADDTPENRRFRLDPDMLTPDAVYIFCESIDAETRELGMQLIERHPRLRLPEELFRLTESPDRNMRAFVIRALWSLYRNRGITSHWKPALPPQAKVGAATRKKTEEAEKKQGRGAPVRPGKPPAGHTGMHDFMRRILFEIPPARLEKRKSEGSLAGLKPLPARKAKLALIEVMRDLALEDESFAKEITPLLEEFMMSRGKSEMAACLVAVTRIRKRVLSPGGE